MKYLLLASRCEIRIDLFASFYQGLKKLAVTEMEIASKGIWGGYMESSEHLNNRISTFNSVVALATGRQIHQLRFAVRDICLLTALLPWVSNYAAPIS